MHVLRHLLKKHFPIRASICLLKKLTTFSAFYKQHRLFHSSTITPHAPCSPSLSKFLSCCDFGVSVSHPIGLSVTHCLSSHASSILRSSSELSPFPIYRHTSSSESAGKPHTHTEYKIKLETWKQCYWEQIDTTRAEGVWMKPATLLTKTLFKLRGSPIKQRQTKRSCSL